LAVATKTTARVQLALSAREFLVHSARNADHMKTRTELHASHYQFHCPSWNFGQNSGLLLALHQLTIPEKILRRKVESAISVVQSDSEMR
jgi:predicted nicotinamide N-methyase